MFTEVIRKCAYQLNALKRTSKILNTKTKMLIYHAFIEANINYCPLIWMNKNETYMKHMYKCELSEWFLTIIPLKLSGAS